MKMKKNELFFLANETIFGKLLNLQEFINYLLHIDVWKKLGNDKKHSYFQLNEIIYNGHTNYVCESTKTWE